MSRVPERLDDDVRPHGTDRLQRGDRHDPVVRAPDQSQRSFHPRQERPESALSTASTAAPIRLEPATPRASSGVVAGSRCGSAIAP